MFQPVGAVIGRQAERHRAGRRALGQLARPRRTGRSSASDSARDPWNDAISLCEAIWVPSIEERKARYPELRISDDVETLVALPLVAHGRAFGVFGLAFALPYRFEEMQRAFLDDARRPVRVVAVERRALRTPTALREAERVAAAGPAGGQRHTGLPGCRTARPTVTNGSGAIDLRGSSAVT